MLILNTDKRLKQEKLFKKTITVVEKNVLCTFSELSSRTLFYKDMVFHLFSCYKSNKQGNKTKQIKGLRHWRKHIYDHKPRIKYTWVCTIKPFTVITPSTSDSWFVIVYVLASISQTFNIRQGQKCQAMTNALGYNINYGYRQFYSIHSWS